jgi:hypothetical protein
MSHRHSAQLQRQSNTALSKDRIWGEVENVWNDTGSVVGRGRKVRYPNPNPNPNPNHYPGTTPNLTVSLTLTMTHT